MITFQNYERMNLADALGPKSFSKGDRIIKQGNFIVKQPIPIQNGRTKTDFLSTDWPIEWDAQVTQLTACIS